MSNKKGLFDDIQELEAVMKFRASFVGSSETLDNLKRENKRLKAENRRLRLLLNDAERDISEMLSK